MNRLISILRKNIILITVWILTHISILLIFGKDHTFDMIVTTLIWYLLLWKTIDEKGR